MIRELAYVGVATPAYEEWQTFGPHVLGAQLADRGVDDVIRLRFDDAGHRLSIRPGPEDRLLWVGWSFANETELADYLTRLRESGLVVTEGTAQETTDRGVAAMSWVQDPWGARHEFVWGQYRRPGTFWPGRRMGGFLTEEFGLGHVVLIVPSLVQADAFYGDQLGFTLSDRVAEEQFQARFYHCNGRHHSLAVAEVPGKVGFNHLMLEVSSLDDVGTGLDVARAHDAPIIRGLGRHTNDLMTSFYLQTPSSFQIEYGHGGMVVDDVTWVAATNDRPSLWGHELSDYGRANPPGILHDAPGAA